MSGDRPTPDVRAGDQTGETAHREAVLGELVHERGEPPDTGWFIVGVDGYFDVDNACWSGADPGDYPWTTEWFDLCGTVEDLIADSAALAVKYAQAQRTNPSAPERVMSATEKDAMVRARLLAENEGPADSPDARSVPHYLQSTALSLADIAQSLRNMEHRL